MAELTLHVPDELVAVTKAEAAARQVSVSKLVTDFFRNLAARNGESAGRVERLAPRTRRLAGCVPDADTQNHLDYLEEKHS